MMEENLPAKITRMIVELHKRDYTSLYLYCGMSPSGLNWRYAIGMLKEGVWPNHNYFVSGSLRKDNALEWADNTADSKSLADCFVNSFSDELSGTKLAHTDYSLWFKKVVDGLADNEFLVFYADYDAPHENLLINAPGYSGR